jgi:hypothetical protein
VSESWEAATLRNILPEHSRSAGTGPMKCRPLSSSILNSSAAMFPPLLRLFLRARSVRRRNQTSF